MTPLDAPALRALTPLLPLVGLFAYFILGLGVYLTVGAVRGNDHLVDKEVTERPASIYLARFWRHFFMWLIAPYERLLVALRVSPNGLTFASLLVAALSGTALAMGRFGLGGWLYILAGVLDVLDGRVARKTGRVSPGGAFFDSVIDRYCELFVFGGLAVFYRDSGVLLLVLGATIGSIMVSYTRARGEALGVDVKVGTMQRPERLAILGAMTAHSPLWDALAPASWQPVPYLPTVIALAILAVSSNLTAVRRVRHTLAHLATGAAAPVPVVMTEPSRPPRRPSRPRLARPSWDATRRLLGLLRTAG